MEDQSRQDEANNDEPEVAASEEPTRPPPPEPDESRALHARSLVARIKGRPETPELPKKSLRNLVALALTLLLVPTVIAVGTWSTYWAAHRNDQYQLLVLGQTVYHGGRMYVDVWENKPPGIAWINTAGYVLSRGRPLAAWILPGALALSVVVLFSMALTKLLSSLTARRAALLAAIIVSLRVYDSPSINPDFYSAIVELAAASLWLLALYSAGSAGRIGLGLLGGLAWALAVTFKQTGVVGLIAVSIGTLIALFGNGVNRRAWLSPALSVWGGFVLGLGAVAGVLFWRQTLELAWHAVFVFNRDLLAQRHLGAALGSWHRAVDGLAALKLPLWLALVGIIATLFARETQRVSRGAVGVLLLWWLLQVSLALVGPSQSMRYWQATWAPMLCLAAVGLYQLEIGFRYLPIGYRAAYVLACATALLMLLRPLAQSYRHGVAESYVTYTDYRQQTGPDDGAAGPGEPSRASARLHHEEIGRRVRELTPEDRKIFVWSFDSGVYIHADRLPASRFPYPRSTLQMEEILTDLEAGKAYALLMPDHPAPAFDRFCDRACQDRLAEIRTAYPTFVRAGSYRIWYHGPDADATH